MNLIANPPVFFRDWKVTTDPASEPVTVATLKTFARIDTSAEDDLLTEIITAVRKGVEDYCGRALITQTITLKLDGWPGRIVELPRPPLIAITSVSTLDEDDTATTYAATNYYAETYRDPGQLVIRQGNTPPINTGRDTGGFQIIYTAGYGSSASDVPAGIISAIKYWATWVYEHRVPVGEPPSVAKMLLEAYRIIRL